jgi:signal transduction histidine kinase
MKGCFFKATLCYYILLNPLSKSAIKYSASNTPIEIQTEEEGDKITVSIKDYGSGIPADYMSHIFDRFYQIEEKMKSGLGLGLYIAKKIIDQHKGRLWVESKVGKGSTFYFSLNKAK